jgi:hypothetical protein
METRQTTSEARGERESRDGFCAYLRQRREAKGIALAEISRITRIPLHNLERLEQGRFEELPADVFVRGFLRSYARCLDLDVDATVQRYAACGLDPAPVASDEAQKLAKPVRVDDAPRGDVGPARPAAELSAPTAALCEPPAPPAPEPSRSIDPDTEAEISAQQDEALAEAGDEARDEAALEGAAGSGGAAAKAPRAAASGGKRRRRGRRGGRRRNGRRRAEPQAEAREVGAADASAPSAPGEAESVSAAAEAERAPVDSAPSGQGSNDAREEAAAVVMPAATPQPAPRPRTVLRIDDDCPEDAERLDDVRPVRRDAGPADDTLRAFLLPNLAEEDSGARRSSLTVAVLILVIVATLAMSMLLRRPSESSDGITRGPAEASALALAPGAASGPKTDRWAL